MSYKLEKPYTEEEKIEFIVQYNHNQGLQIEETETSLFALLPNEIMQNGKPIIDPEFENKQFVIQAKKEILQIETLLNELDVKRIRAFCEPSIKDTETGETWLEHYNAQILELREQLQTLQERIIKYDIIE